MLKPDEKAYFLKRLLRPPISSDLSLLTNKVICGDSLKLLPELPRHFVDLLILDCVAGDVARARVMG